MTRSTVHRVKKRKIKEKKRKYPLFIMIMLGIVAGIIGGEIWVNSGRVTSSNNQTRELTRFKLNPGKNILTETELKSRAQKDLAEKLKTRESNIVLVKSEAVTWNDGSLGCPKEGMVYTQVLTEGYRFVFKYNGKEYSYHSNLKVGMPCED